MSPSLRAGLDAMDDFSLAIIWRFRATGSLACLVLRRLRLFSAGTRSAGKVRTRAIFVCIVEGRTVHDKLIRHKLFCQGLDMTLEVCLESLRRQC